MPSWRTLVPAQDFKRIGDDDAGPNTGGMGAYAPLPWLPDGLAEEVVRTVAAPTIAEMARRGTPFAGLLYVGLAMTARGPRVVEFNARFGDPETQVVLALLETPLTGLLHAAATGALAQHPPLRWRPGAAVTVVLAAAGYPGTPRAGDVITGAEQPGSCMPAPAAATTAPCCPPAAGCCPRRRSGRRWPTPGTGHTRSWRRSISRAASTATTSPGAPSKGPFRSDPRWTSRGKRSQSGHTQRNPAAALLP